MSLQSVRLIEIEHIGVQASTSSIVFPGSPPYLISNSPLPRRAQQRLDLRGVSNGLGVVLHGAALKRELREARQVGFPQSDARVAQVLGQGHMADPVGD